MTLDWQFRRLMQLFLANIGQNLPGSFWPVLAGYAYACNPAWFQQLTRITGSWAKAEQIVISQRLGLPDPYPLEGPCGRSKHQILSPPGKGSSWQRTWNQLCRSNSQLTLAPIPTKWNQTPSAAWEKKMNPTKYNTSNFTVHSRIPTSRRYIQIGQMSSQNCLMISQCTEARSVPMSPQIF